jgi:branched-chain amino acid transport system substrate-binding protein
MKMQAPLLAGIGVVFLSSCSLLIDSKTTQCEKKEDCDALGGEFVGMMCSPTEKICVKSAECTKNIECKTQPALCRAPAPSKPKECVVLNTNECQIRAEASDLTDENTLWFGLVSPRMDAAHMEAASELVRKQIGKSGNLPPAQPTGPPRPLAFISCTTNMMSLEKSLDHLIKVGVPAIVGSNASGDVITMLNRFTTRASVLSISPTASAPNISDIDNKGLFFRTSGTDTIAVKTLAHVLRAVVEPQMRAGAKPVLGPMEQMKVAVMYRGDALGMSNVNAAASTVTFNGKSTSQNGANYKVIDYGDPGDPNQTLTLRARYDASVSDVINFRPHVIFVFGSTEFQDMDKQLEANWPATAPYRPFYLVVKGIANVFASHIGTNMDWAKRVLGAQPYIDKSTTAYAAYESAFKSAFPALAPSASVTATPSYFDATYVLAYAVAANGAAPITGQNLANAIRNRLTPAPAGSPPAQKIFVGYDTVLKVFQALGQNERVDLQGLTGNLDFDSKGDVDQTQEVFCMKTESSETGSPKVTGVKNAGMIFDPTLEQVTGAITDCPGP